MEDSTIPQQDSSTPNLPNYPEMIMAAIEELKDPNGSNKSAISKQIESTNLNLPAAHSTLLAHHLNNMKNSGQLLLVKNNYMKPDPNAPPKRGRGRPPKTATVPSDAVVSPPRPRGRPPKPKDLGDATAKSNSAGSGGSGRPRGRPPKKAKTEMETETGTEVEEQVETVVLPVGSGTPRGRGRPPKAKPAVVPVAG